MSELETHILVNPTVEQLRCCTKIVSKRQTDKGTAYELLFSHDIAREIIQPEVQPWRPVVIG